MTDENRINAPKLILDENNNVIDANTGKPVEGIAVFGARPTLGLAEESPATALQRWSKFRQSSAKAE